MSNKIVDLDRLKDYAEKESVLLGKRVKDAVLFDGTVTLTSGQGEIPGLELYVGETYKVTVGSLAEKTLVAGEYMGYPCVVGTMEADNFAIMHEGSFMTGIAGSSIAVKIVGVKRQFGNCMTLPNSNVVNGEGRYSIGSLNGFNELTGDYAAAVGAYNEVPGYVSAAVGQMNTVSGDASVAVGYRATASGDYSVAEGGQTEASGMCSHAEGELSKATSEAAHAEGAGTLASGEYSHAEGFKTKATYGPAHAEGFKSEANGESSHAEGNNSIAGGACAHAEGAFTKATGNYSHAEGYCTTAGSKGQHVQGIGNVPDPDGNYVDIVGFGDVSGTDVTLPRNIEVTTALKNDGTGGDKILHGDVYVGAAFDSTGGQKLIRPSEMGTPVYDATKTYQVNQVVYEPNTDRFYKCKTAITTAEDFNSAKWTEIKFGDGYLTRHNPTGTGSLSMNRKSGTTVGANSTTLGENNTASGACSIAGGYGGSSVASGIGSICLAMESSTNDNLSTIIGGATNIIDKKGKGSESNTIIGAENSKIQGKTYQSTIIGGTQHTIEYADQTMNCTGGIILGGSTSKVSAPVAATIGGYYLEASEVAQTAIGVGNVPTQRAILVLGNGSRNGEGALVERRNAEITTTDGDKKMRGDVYVHCEKDSSGGVNICDTVKVTKAELNQLITDKKLIPGLLYQITDYEYTCGKPNVMPFSETTKYVYGNVVTHDGKMWTYQYNLTHAIPMFSIPDYAPNPGAWSTATASGASTPRWVEVQTSNKSAGKQFDICLQAVQRNKLAENGCAVLHGTDTSLTDANGTVRDLTKWKIEYDVSTHRISYMVDEFGNSAPYDLINNLVARYATTDALNGDATGNYGLSYVMGPTTYNAYFGEDTSASTPWITGSKVTQGATATYVPTFGPSCKNVRIDKGSIHGLDTSIDDGVDIVFGESCNDIHVTHGGFYGTSAHITVGKRCNGINIHGCDRVTICEGTNNVNIECSEKIFIRKFAKNINIAADCQSIQIGNGATNIRIGEGSKNLELIGQQRAITIGNGCVDLFIKNQVAECTFMDNANAIWLDSVDASASAWLRGFVFETGCTGWKNDGSEGSSLATPLRVGDCGLENNTYGTKHVFFSKIAGFNPGLPVVSWYEGITLKGKYKNVSDQSSAGNWTTL